MIVALLLGLLVAAATMTIIALMLLGFKWLKEYITKKLKEKENHKVAFADTKEVVDEYLKNKAEDSDEVSMDDLEKACDGLPAYVSVSIDDETGEMEYEGINPEKVDDNFKARMKQQKGMILFE